VQHVIGKDDSSRFQAFREGIFIHLAWSTVMWKRHNGHSADDLGESIAFE
jgi:hypothetical protein